MGKFRLCRNVTPTALISDIQQRLQCLASVSPSNAVKEVWWTQETTGSSRLEQNIINTAINKWITHLHLLKMALYQIFII